MKRSVLSVGMALLCVATLQAQEGNQSAPRTLPARLNPVAQPVRLPPPPAAAPAPVDPHAGHNHGTPTPTNPTTTIVAQPVPVMDILANTVLAWDAEMKDYTTKPGEVQGSFTFYFTNVSSKTVAITSAAASCGCTVPKLPPLPWKIEPGAGGEIPVVMNVPGKTGMIMKTVTVNTDHGRKVLTVRVNITPPDQNALAAMRPVDRTKNLELAKADRQAIFKGDCASCHVEKGRGKLGKELYDASCGICHDAEHRADMVPDLRNLKHDTNADYWRTWISLGKPGSLMPGFAQSEGGPLTPAEINSLVQYLATTIPAKAARPAAGN